MDDRERNLEEYDDSLAERASELDQHQETLQHYLDAQAGTLEQTVSDAIHNAIADREEHRQVGRFGATGTVLIGLVGVAFAAGGVGYAVWLEYATSGGLFGSVLADVTLAGGLVIIGIGLTLLSITTPPQ